MTRTFFMWFGKRVWGPCDHGNECSRSIQGGKFLDQLRNFKLFKKDFAPRSKVVKLNEDYRVTFFVCSINSARCWI